MEAYVGTGGGADRMPLIKYSAMDGSFRTSDRINEGGEWRSVDQDIQLPTQFVMDFANVEIGWIKYNPKPDFIMVKSGEPRPERPDELDAEGKPAYKWGFRIQLGNPNVGLRELSTSSKNVYDAMLALFKAWEAEKANNPGMMPVVHIEGTTRTEAGWRIPQWSIAKWVPNPDFMSGAPTQPAPAAAAPAATPAPAAAPQPPAATGTDLF